MDSRKRRVEIVPQFELRSPDDEEEEKINGGICRLTYYEIESSTSFYSSTSIFPESSAGKQRKHSSKFQLH